MNAYQVSVAAEAYAAALFAQAGCDVSIQYGANQPEYDLIASRNGVFRKVSVKGSQDGGWVLATRFKTPRVTYHQAIEQWYDKHADQCLLYCFVQFYGVAFGRMPAVHLASCREVADYMRSSRGGLGFLAVRQDYTWSKGGGAGARDLIPATWAFTESRVKTLLKPL